MDAYLPYGTAGLELHLAAAQLLDMSPSCRQISVLAQSSHRFDDFTWGETRRVHGEVKGLGHDLKEGLDASSTVPLRRWEDWERSRLRKLKRDAERRAQFERQFDSNQVRSDDGQSSYVRHRSVSDGFSVFSSEDDLWGANIGGYDENDEHFPPPPTTLLPESHEYAPTVRYSMLAQQLDNGFDDDDTKYQDQHTPPKPITRYTLQDNY